MSSALLGIALAAYLWLHAGVRDPVRLATVALAAILGDGVMLFGGFAGLVLSWMVSSDGTTTQFVVTTAAGAVGAAVVASVFLRVLPPKGTHLTLEVACCATAGAGSVLVWYFLARFPALAAAGPVAWHVAVAISLAVVTALRLRPVAADPFRLRCLVGAGVVGFCVMLVANSGATPYAAATSRPVVVPSPYFDAIRAAKIASVKDAPPSAELPALAPGAAEEMFVRPMAGIACHPARDVSFPPDTKQVETLLLHVPAHREYHLQCYRLEDAPNARVSVLILHYPNDAWAQYELRHQRGHDRLFDQRYVERTTTHDRPMFVFDHRTYWVSGDKILCIFGGGAPAETVRAFVDVYLRRYPNSLDPDFDLPYLPRPE